ncbi:MAG: ABC transporter ATP-binding protein [Candidatus Dormibacteraeota bacterium]|nr:ABC transporter ATP-binding protein [Candidatus Dormibacteraeota bacterium]
MTASRLEDIVIATDLRKRYHVSRPPRDVLRGVSLRVSRGEFVAIMGASGSGKSTLLHILGGLEAPDSGSVRIAGIDVNALRDSPRSAFRRDHVGFVFQSFNLLPTLSAAENIALPLRLRNQTRLGRGGRLASRAILDRVETLMDQLNLHGLQGHSPEEISGGEQQRVAIARALAASPLLLLADEPTGNLDWSTGHDVMGVLRKLCAAERQTALLVTHDARVAAYADRVLVMRDGMILAEFLQPAQRGRRGEHPDAGPLVARLAQLEL